MVHKSELEPGEKVFTHIDPDSKVQTDFAVDRIIEWAEKNKQIVLVSIAPHAVKLIIEHRGLEGHRFMRVSEFTHYDPIIFAKFNDGTHLLCDGNHRYVVMYYKNIPLVQAYILTEDEWRPFQIEGHRKYNSVEELMRTNSGIE